MIDDSKFSLIIYNIEVSSDTVKLSIADPHIYSNRDDEFKNVGSYDVLLDKEGKQISNTITNESV